VLACASQPEAGGKVVPTAGPPAQFAPDRLPRPPRNPGTVFAAEGAPSPIYVAPPLRPDERSQRRLAPLERALLQVVGRIARARGLPPPLVERRLLQMAADVARVARSGELPPSEVVRFLANHHGVIEPDPVVFALHGQITQQPPAPDEERIVLHRYETAMANVFDRGAWNRIGVAVAQRDRELVTVVAMWEQFLELKAIPREVPSAGSVTLSGRFLRNHRDAQVVVTLPSGDVRRLPLRLHRTGFESELRCASGDGRYQLEVLAADDSGPTVLANFPLYCGVKAPRDVLVYQEEGGEVDPADGEQELFALINRDRRAAGLSPLEWNNQLAAVARSHSREMASLRFVAHVSPTTGSTEGRARRAGIPFPLVTENVGLEGGIQQAHEGFMDSPGHRANILNPKVTHVGIGVILAAGRSSGSPLYITELFGGER
jgi:uncharacterized protein YkwD